MREDGTAVCWGNNDDGELDAPGGGFKSVSAGSDHNCGIRDDDTVVCWGSLEVHLGSPTDGFLDRDQDEPETTRDPTPDTPQHRLKSVSAGRVHSCGVREDGTAVCWGDNDSGQADAPGGVFKSVSAGGQLA